MVKSFGCTKQFCILQLPKRYCVSLIMVTITRHMFINIFRMEDFSAVNLPWVMRFLVIPKSPKLGKIAKIGLGSFINEILKF